MNQLLPPISGAFKENLSEWEDPDITVYKLAISLGMLVSDDGSYDQFRDYKSTFCTSNLVGDFLYETLDRLIALGFVEYDDVQHKCRWNKEAKIEED